MAVAIVIAANFASHDSLGLVLAEQSRFVRRFNKRAGVNLEVRANEWGICTESRLVF